MSGATCDSAEPLLAQGPSAQVDGESLLARVGTLQSRSWADAGNLAALAAAREPALLHGGAIDKWGARQWDWAALASRMGEGAQLSVSESESHRYAPIDADAPLRPLLPPSAPLATERNWSAAALFGRMAELEAELAASGAYERSPSSRTRWRRAHAPGLVHFGDVPPLMRSALEPQDFLYLRATDRSARMQSMWVSSPGVRTHTHFDSDHNAFVQLIGTKRFLLWPPNQTDHLCPFPRLHPLWHKSRADFEQPHASCATYANSTAIGVTVGPGDTLYVPPMWWHTVETLSPSLSLTALSRYSTNYDVSGAYTLEQHFDKLRHKASRVYALRAFIGLLAQRASPGDPSADVALAARIRRRYAGLPLAAGGEAAGDAEAAGGAAAKGGDALCVLNSRGTPTCRNCLAHAQSDASIVWDEWFVHVDSGERSTLLEDYVEELIEHTVGAELTLPFLAQCFEGQPFYLTTPGSDEHRALWAEGEADDD